ncbi:MAG: transposase, partial [Chloroflexi bacterium]|nr:transposase [Chloroflexota bacterium]
MRQHIHDLQVSYQALICRYVRVRPEQAALRMRLRELAAVRVSYGYERPHLLLRREGWHVNHKRLYRLYRDESLCLRRKHPQRWVARQRREIRPTATRREKRCSLDFMHDELIDGRCIRTLTLVDHLARESPPLVIYLNLTGHRVVDALGYLALQSRPRRGGEAQRRRRAAGRLARGRAVAAPGYTAGQGSGPPRHAPASHALPGRF